MTRLMYWKEVVKLCGDRGLKLERNRPLHWQTIELLAKCHGFSRNHIKNPAYMADVIERKFRPMEL